MKLQEELSTSVSEGVRCADHLDASLDEALEETFPASDPVAIHVTRSFAHTRPQTLRKAHKLSRG